MDGLYLVGAGEVGNGTSDLEDAAIGTGRELQTLHGHAQHIETLSVWLCKLVEHLFGHLGIAMDTCKGLIALLLNLTGTDNTLADSGARFAWLHL